MHRLSGHEQADNQKELSTTSNWWHPWSAISCKILLKNWSKNRIPPDSNRNEICYTHGFQLMICLFEFVVLPFGLRILLLLSWTLWPNYRSTNWISLSMLAYMKLWSTSTAWKIILNIKKTSEKVSEKKNFIESYPNVNLVSTKLNT